MVELASRRLKGTAPGGSYDTQSTTLQLDRHQTIPLAVRDEESSYRTKGPLGLTTLYHPDDAVVDLIFVHGIGGGSFETWAKNGDSTLYWPKVWLPEDGAFKDVRINTFGYNWNLNKEGILGIHDFAQSLLSSIQDALTIHRKQDTSIIFVGHSIGGLIIKKAFMLARQLQSFQSIARRVSSIFFLATPHHGFGYAQVLRNVLAVSGQEPSITDFQRTSLAAQSINDEFPQYCKSLQLYSFYETVPVFGKSLIVDKDCAILGYVNERQTYLNADHHDICQFTSHHDQNYLTIRNALASVVESLRPSIISSKLELKAEEKNIIQNALGIFDAPEDALVRLDQRRMEGSCEWLLHNEKFLDWRNSTSAYVYWLYSGPGTGKSVLSAYMVNHLRSLFGHCAFFFFSYGDKSRSDIRTFLCSLAWQLASKDSELLDIVLEVCKETSQLSSLDVYTIWRKLFLGGLLRAEVNQVYCCVVDALDECTDEVVLIPILLKLVNSGLVRIFSTSRKPFQTQMPAQHKGTKVITDKIPVEDTKRDIMLYTESKINHLDMDDAKIRTIAAQVLEKSSGSFLWVSLVLQELRQVTTYEEYEKVLRNLPVDMTDMYYRILDNMAQARSEQTLAKAILTWVVCATRPLTTLELGHALQLDLKATFNNMEECVIANCGNLLLVDAKSRVQLLHQSVKDFLLDPQVDSPYAIHKRSGHGRLAIICLRYLCSDAMKAPNHSKFRVTNASEAGGHFIEYAASAFHQHIAQVSAQNEEFLVSLVRFFSSSNVLSWIQYICEKSELDHLIATGKAIKNYLERRAKHNSPLGKEFRLLDAWATDLTRLVPKFGKQLTAHPFSIFHLIPPFCPQESPLRNQSANSRRSIIVKGLSGSAWNDCLSTISYPQDTVLSLATSNLYFAVGLSSGRVIIYDDVTCQEVRALMQSAPVRVLQFGNSGTILASACTKYITVWDVISRNLLWKFKISYQCMAIAFSDEGHLLLAALKNNILYTWDLATGTLHDAHDWTQNLEDRHGHNFQRPNAAAFSPDLSQLAVLYRGRPIYLWDLESHTLVALYSKQTIAELTEKNGFSNELVWSVVFSSAPSSTLMAAAYSGGDVVLFDTSEGTILQTSFANAHMLASSPDGRTLASADYAGTIQLFDFETLTLLYRIRSEEYGIKCVAFSGDNQRLLDIRRSHCRVWEPVVLIRRDIDEDYPDDLSGTTAAYEVELTPPDEAAPEITTLVCHDNGQVFFCGKDDGSVGVYSTHTGLEITKAFDHATRASISSMFFDSMSCILSSADSSGCVMSHLLSQKHSQAGWDSKCLFKYSADETIDQLLGNKEHTRLLICTASEHILFSIEMATTKRISVIERTRRESCFWAPHPTNSAVLVLVQGNTAHLYSWKKLEQLTTQHGILLKGITADSVSFSSVSSCLADEMLVTSLTDSTYSNAIPKVLLWHSLDFSTESESASPVANYRFLDDQVQLIIGDFASRLVFLNSSGWICSTQKTKEAIPIINRHFFLPSDWLSTPSTLKVSITINGDIIVVRRTEVAVIKRGLDRCEADESRISSRTPLSSKTPSPAVTRAFSINSPMNIPSDRSSLASRRSSNPFRSLDTASEIQLVEENSSQGVLWRKTPINEEVVHSPAPLPKTQNESKAKSKETRSCEPEDPEQELSYLSDYSDDTLADDISIREYSFAQNQQHTEHGDSNSNLFTKISKPESWPAMKLTHEPRVISSLDCIKNFIQNATMRPIIWWPLATPQTASVPSQLEVFWHCQICSERLYSHLSEGLAQKFAISHADDESLVSLEKDSISAANEQIREKSLVDHRPGEPSNNPTDSGHINAPSSGFSSASYTGTPSSANQNSHQQNTSQRAPRRYPPEALKGFKPSNDSASDITKKWIHWCVNSARIRFVNICVCGMGDLDAKTGQQFIQALKSSYRMLRGFRWWISLTDCAKIKMVKFVRLLDDQDLAAYSPETVKLDDIRPTLGYEISKCGMLEDLLHIAWVETTLAHYLQKHGSAADKEVDAIISGLPKRIKSCHDMKGRSYGYGIRAIHGWSVIKILCLFIISAIPGLLFFGFWLVRYPGDLQNAAVPYFMMLTTFPCVTFMVDLYVD